MILNHLWGLYAHPKEEWHSIEERQESYFYSLSHIAIVSLIPVLMSYYSAAYLGWSIGAGDIIKLTTSSALLMSVGMYFGLMIGVLALSGLVFELAKAFDASPTYTQSLELEDFLHVHHVLLHAGNLLDTDHRSATIRKPLGLYN